MAVTPVSTRVFTAPSVSPRACVCSNRTLSLAFSSSSNHASRQLSLMTKYSFSSWKSVGRSPQAAMATSVSQSTHRIADIMATLKVQGKVIVLTNFSVSFLKSLGISFQAVKVVVDAHCCCCFRNLVKVPQNFDLQ
jgi:hypothetical protein